MRTRRISLKQLPKLHATVKGIRPTIGSLTWIQLRATRAMREILFKEFGGFPSVAAKEVAEFHSKAGLMCHSLPTTDIPAEIAKLRTSLLTEEVAEFTEASKAADLKGIADALADIVYVAYGAALTYGIDLDAVLTEVHRSNMTKLDTAAKPLLRADGKVLKSPLYVPPDIDGVLREQAPLPIQT
jgi:predicted HAD superfamily Cof-like phosphohydrolase